jgi:hypothetical protein
MIFYKVEPADGPYLVATQVEAKREAREHKCTWSQVDVPTDKAGLMAFINEMLIDTLTADEDIDTSDEGPEESPYGGMRQPKAEPALAAPYGKQQDSWTTTEIEDFILNRASINQVSNIFARLGTRFAELAKAKVELTGLLD